MSGTTLFVVDMQSGFGACRECTNEVLREIHLARRRKDGIVFVELNPNNWGMTIPKLVNAAHADGYPHVAFTTKTLDNGSAELVEKAHSVGFPVRRVRVCGVNRNACVQATLRGLLYDIPTVLKVEVGFGATAPGARKWGDDHDYWRKSYIDMIADGLILRP